jgi:hypothetical protein
VDSTGRVVLHGEPNTEKDLYGYRVYRANFLSEEFSQVTVGPVPDTVFTDTINVRTLTRSVYYKVWPLTGARIPPASRPLSL